MAQLKLLAFGVLLGANVACGSSAKDSGGAAGQTSTSMGGSGGQPSVGGQPAGGGAPLTAGTSGSGNETGVGGSPTPVCTDPPAPAPATTWVNATGNLAGMASECQNLAKIAAKPCSKTVIAGVSLHGLWATDDAGKTWRALGTGAGSAMITNRTTSMVFDPVHPDTFWETGIFGDNHGLYTTTDGGQTFTELGTLASNQLVSVDFSDPARMTLVAGTHGERQMVFRSVDGGQTFDNVGLNLPAGTHNSESPIVLGPQTHLLGACGGGDGICGIFRTTDGGKTWVSKSDLMISHFGAPLWASDGAIYWPLFGDGGLAKSTDLGLTWSKIVDAGMLVGVSPVELQDGSIAAVGMDHLMRSKDGGMTWQPIGEPLPFSIAQNDQGSLTYSVQAQTFFLSHWDCNNAVLPNAIMSAGFDSSAP